MITTRIITDPPAIPTIKATSSAGGFGGGGAISTVILKVTRRAFVSSLGFREEFRKKRY